MGNGGFCVGVCPQQLRELSLGTIMVADRGAVLALFASLSDERVQMGIVFLHIGNQYPLHQ